MWDGFHEQRHFEVYNTDDAKRIKLSRLCMEGSTIHWFNIWRAAEQSPTWSSLKQALILRYGGTRYDNPYEALKVLHQVGTVEEYIKTFEFVSSQLPNLSEQQYVGYFMDGLKLEIRQRVHTLRPGTRWQVMEFARDIEAETEGIERFVMASQDVLELHLQ